MGIFDLFRMMPRGAGFFTLIMPMVSFVWSILLIILFIKVWKMTNNVKTIHQDMCGANDFNERIHLSLLKGDFEKVQKLVLNRFYNNVISGDKIVESDKKQLECVYKSIGKEVPPIIMEITSKYDLKKLIGANTTIINDDAVIVKSSNERIRVEWKLDNNSSHQKNEQGELLYVDKANKDKVYAESELSLYFTPEKLAEYYKSDK